VPSGRMAKSMENLLQSIRTLQDRPSDAGTPSIVIGGVAVAAWGEPRVTRDVDLKVLLGCDDADCLLAALAPDYVSLLPDPRKALRQQAVVFMQDTGDPTGFAVGRHAV